MTVTEANLAAKSLLESHFSSVEISGEISRFIRHGSGHWYFTLKDEKSAISAAMFSYANARVTFAPKDGLEVVVRGKLTVFPPQGSYQVQVTSMSLKGAGELERAFNELKTRLNAEGLFDSARKKPLPAFPRRVGIITSATGAAWQDILSRINESRYFLAKFYLFDSLVQGVGAPASLISALRRADEMGLDAIILARGGGSMEDLWCFNDEALARAIARTRTPVISAVGHEIDYTISDFVADHRSITPTASIVDLLHTYEELAQSLDAVQISLKSSIDFKFESARGKLKTAFLTLKSLGITQKINNSNLNLEKREIALKNVLSMKLFKFENALPKRGELKSKLDFKFEKASAKVASFAARLESAEQFFDRAKNLVCVQKNGRATKLEDLSANDKITLSSLTATRRAVITE